MQNEIVENVENVVVLEIRRKMVNMVQNGKKKSFPSFIVYVNLPERGEDGKLTEPKGHWINLRFRQDLEDSALKVSDLKTGKLTVKEKFLQCPFVYEVKETEELDANGEPKKEYPTAWVKGGIVDFKPFEVHYTNSMFARPTQE